MISDCAYLRLFQTDQDILSRSEMKKMLDAELSKDDPDTELIEYCMDALDEPDAPPCSRGGDQTLFSENSGGRGSDIPDPSRQRDRGGGLPERRFVRSADKAV